MDQLDGLRTLAVTGVIFAHTMTAPWQALSTGFLGVELFFVLSGFLIAGILLRARRSAEAAGLGPYGVMGAFYARRVLRIFPLYYLVMLGAAWLDIPQVRENLWATLTYMSNMSDFLTFNRLPDPLRHLWSLASEEQFYLFVPAILLLSRWKSLPTIALAMVLLGPLSRLAIGIAWGEMRAALEVLPGCLDTLGAGVLLAIIREMRLKWQCPYPRLLVALAVAMMVLTVTQGGRLHSTVLPLSMISLFTVVPCVWLVSRASVGFGGWFGKLLENDVLRYIGKISYGMYLLHEFIRMECRIHFPKLYPVAGWEQFGVIFAITVALAALSWHVFELPINLQKRFFPYVRPAGTRVPTATKK